MVRVAHYAQLTRFFGQVFGNHVLGAVGVLVFVHEHVLEKILVISTHVGMVAQELHGFDEEVAKVKCAGFF